MTNADSPNDPGHLRPRRHPFRGARGCPLHPADPRRRPLPVSAANFLELSIVIESQIGPEASRQCDAFFRRADIIIEAFTAEQAHLARQAFLDFGKGRHSAGLNFGDCFAYALAKITGEPLLFKGEDFKKTDIRSALEREVG